MNNNIIINLQVAGLHHWKDCNILEVDYLKNQHRHIFYICCKKSINELDRQIEIICFKNQIINYIEKSYKDNFIVNFKGMSCEMIANNLLNEFDLSYCRVLEDNENGAEVYK